eukprot:6183998-Pleurochrysis_carterae.AAC.4
MRPSASALQPLSLTRSSHPACRHGSIKPWHRSGVKKCKQRKLNINRSAVRTFQIQSRQRLVCLENLSQRHAALIVESIAACMTTLRSTC